MRGPYRITKEGGSGHGTSGSYRISDGSDRTICYVYWSDVDLIATRLRYVSERDAESVAKLIARVLTLATDLTIRDD